MSIHHLIYDETQLHAYDTNFKSNPPLRTDLDKKALIKGVSDGTIDVIVSSHSPQDEENKKLEFDRAAFGLTGLQTFWPQLNSLAKEIGLEKLIEKITDAPREILNLTKNTIQEKEVANLTLFSEKEEWLFNDKTNKSKSTNSPLYNTIQKGKVMAVVNGTKSQIDPSL